MITLYTVDNCYLEFKEIIIYMITLYTVDNCYLEFKDIIYEDENKIIFADQTDCSLSIN